MRSEARGERGGGGRETREQPVDLGSFTVGFVNAITWGVRDELEPDGINAVEYAILRALQYSETSTATQLGHLLPIDQSRISRAVNTLVSRSLVRRRRLRSDRRVVTLDITDEGRELIGDLSQRVQQRYDTLLDGVSPEDIRGFLATGAKIMENHDAAAGEQ